MADEKVEVIIVGGGLAGLTAATVLAREGVEVLLIERGTYCGAKNMTGGKLYSHSIEKVFPDFESKAPVERIIKSEEVYSMGANSIERCDSPVGHTAEPSKAYSVLRAKLDAWLSEQAENEGAMIVQNIVVDSLIVEGGKVCGVVTGDERMYADVVILADGVNSLLAQSIGLRPELDPARSCVGVKEVISLSEDKINRRFGLNSGEGAERMYMGKRSEGQYADGFIYTGKDSVSIGIEFLISDINNTDNSVPEMLEQFKEREGVAELIEGGVLSEYSAHVVHHGAEEISGIYGDGVLVAGDAAALVANFGSTVRGMDLAVESGRLAAETVLAAREKQAYSSTNLSAYQTAVENSFIAKEMRLCREYFADKH